VNIVYTGLAVKHVLTQYTTVAQ